MEPLATPPSPEQGEAGDLSQVPSDLIEHYKSKRPRDTKDLKLPNRLVVVAQLCHQVSGEPPTPFDIRYTQALQSDDTAFSRPKLLVTEEWQLLDFGWCKDNFSVLAMKNEEGKWAQVQPSPEEIAEAAKKIIEIRLGTASDNPLLLPPGRSQYLHPSTKSVYVRCQHGTARLRYVVFPG